MPDQPATQQPSLISLPKDWPWVLLLAALFGGIAGLANGLRANHTSFPCRKNAVDFLLGALAGIFGVGLIRPGDALGVATTAGLAGWLKDAFIAERANQYMSAKADAAEEMLEDLGGLADEAAGLDETEETPSETPTPVDAAVQEVAATEEPDFGILEDLDPATRRQVFDQLMESLDPAEQEIAKRMKNVLFNDQEGGK